MKKKFFIHFGAHKTGTTFIQFNLNNNIKYFEKNKSFFISKKIIPQEINEIIRWQWGEAGRPDELPPLLNDYLLSLEETDYDSYFLSYEGLLGRLNLGKTGIIYPDHYKYLVMLKKALCKYDIKVAFCLRNYGSYIESAFKWLMKEGLQDDFKDFRDGLQIEKFSWVPIVESLTSVFGPQNCYFWTYELFDLNPFNSILNLLDFFYGSSFIEDIHFSPNEKVNYSYNSIALNMIKKFNLAMTEIPDFSEEQISLMRKKIKKVLSDVFNENNDPLKPALLSLEEIRYLDKKYNDDLQIMGFLTK